MHKFLLVLRRTFLVLFAVLFALLLPVTATLSAVAFAFSDLEGLSASLVSEEYLDAAVRVANDAFSDTAITYGIEKDVLVNTLSAQREAMKQTCVDGLYNLFTSVQMGKEVVAAVFPAEPFEEALEACFAAMKAENPNLTVREGAVQEIASDCSKIVTTACSPVGTGLFANLVNSISGKLPIWIWSALIPGSVAGTALLLVLGAAVFFLSRRGKRTFALLSTLFCGATLLFVPSFFLFSSVNLQDLALSRGVLYFLIEGLLSSVVSPLRMIALCVFVLSVLSLLVLLVLYLRRSFRQTPEREMPSEDGLSQKDEADFDGEKELGNEESGVKEALASEDDA